MSDTYSDGFEACVERAARALVNVRHDVQGSFVTTPLAYPGGAAVIVWVDRAQPHYLVSDYGFAMAECELMGLERRGFSRRANATVGHAGLRLSNDGAIEIIVDSDQLTGAVAAVANASLEVVTAAAHKLHAGQRADARTVLQRKLSRVFGESAVVREVEFQGASSTQWQIDLAVRDGEGISLFDTVTPFFPSVASTLAKFGDIKLLEGAPRRTSVLSASKEAYGSWTAALSQMSSVVQASAADAAFARLGPLH